MKTLGRYLCAGVVVFIAMSGVGHANYLPVYLERCEGLDLEKKGDHFGALVRFRVNLVYLKRVQQVDPSWEHNLVMKAITDYNQRVAELEPLATEQIRNDNRVISPVPVESRSISNQPDAWKAMNVLEEYRTRLELVHRIDPSWQSDVIKDHLKKADEEMDRLAATALKAYNESSHGSTLQ